MTITASPPGLQPEEYDEIEAAVASTCRGRLFLAEHARRVRGAESARMLAAIERLEARLEAQQALAPLEAFTLADRLTELSWSLRESGVEDFVCGKIDALAREFRGAGGVARTAQGGGYANAEEAAPAALSSPEHAASQEMSMAPRPETAPVATLPEEPLPAPAPRPTEPQAALTPGSDEPDERLAALAPGPDERLAALSWLDRLPLLDRFALFA